MQLRSDRFSLATSGGFAAIALWSTTFAIARSLSEQIGPLTAGAAVYLIGGGFCLLRLWQSRTPFRHLWSPAPRYLVGCGLLFILYTAAIYAAVGLARDREQLLEIALINYLWPAGTILLSLALLKQRASLWLLPGTALALTGVFLVMTQGAHVSRAFFWEHLQGNPMAYGLALIAAVAWALYSNLARLWSAPDQGGAVMWFMPATGVVLLAMRAFTPEATVWTGRAVGEAVALGTVTALAYAFWDGAMRQGNLLLVVAASYLTPLLSTLVSCAYLNVAPGPRLWVGCALLVTGSLLSWRSVSERPLHRERSCR